MNTNTRPGLAPEVLWWMAAAALLLVTLLMMSCSASAAPQALAALEQLRDQGTLTAQQFNDLALLLTNNGRGVDGWGRFLENALTIVGAWLGVPWIAALARGSIHKRKGEAPALPAPATAAA